MSVESRARLAQIDAEYEAGSRRTADVYRAAAKADAAYRRERAKKALWFKESGERMSVAEAELRADASDEVSRLYEARLVAQAERDALADVLRALRERCANGRTFITDERAGDEMHARGGRP